MPVESQASHGEAEEFDELAVAALMLGEALHEWEAERAERDAVALQMCQSEGLVD